MKFVSIILALLALAACSSDFAMTKPISGRPGCYHSWHGTECYTAAMR